MPRCCEVLMQNGGPMGEMTRKRFGDYFFPVVADATFSGIPCGECGELAEGSVHMELLPREEHVRIVVYRAQHVDSKFNTHQVLVEISP